MVQNYQRTVTDEQRRDFLKALGLGGAVAVGSLSLDEIRTLTSGATGTAPEELAPVGEAIRAEMAGSLDAGVLDAHQSSFAQAGRMLPGIVGMGVPESGQRADFAPVAAAGQPIYDHLVETGFFETTTEELPKFTPETITEGVQAFVASEALARPLTQIGFSGYQSGDGVGLLAEVVGNAQQIADYHWVATDELDREVIEFGEFVPPMTQGAAGGVLLWLGDLDEFLWKQSVLLTANIFDTAVWHAHSMAAGFNLMTEAARSIAGESSAGYSDGEIATLLTTGFAMQAIAQGLLPPDVYWVSEEMRAPVEYERIEGTNEYRTVSARGD
jgi:hypothetical protein